MFKRLFAVGFLAFGLASGFPPAAPAAEDTPCTCFVSPLQGGCVCQGRDKWKNSGPERFEHPLAEATREDAEAYFAAEDRNKAKAKAESDCENPSCACGNGELGCHCDVGGQPCACPRPALRPLREVLSRPVVIGAAGLGFRRATDTTVRVYGPPDKLVHFLLAYQDNQWPSWRTDRGPGADENRRRFAEHASDAARKGSVEVDVSSDITRKAFIHAITQ